MRIPGECHEYIRQRKQRYGRNDDLHGKLPVEISNRMKRRKGAAIIQEEFFRPVRITGLAEKNQKVKKIVATKHNTVMFRN